MSSTLRGVESTTCQENLCKPCNNTEFLTCCDSSNSCVYDSIFNEYICIPPYKWICASENQAELEMKGCENGISCDQVEANGFTFDCRFAGDADSGVPALMLHGFPEWSDMYMDLMRRLAKEGFRSAACNMRGYSPGAKPKGVEDYDYDVLASDVEAISEAIFGSNVTNLNLIGHDHGAALGWSVAASEWGEKHVSTYTSLSIPHLDAFSAGLNGENVDVEQQIASQYFTMFILNNSASLHHEFFYYTLAKTSGDKYSEDTFPNSEAFQLAMYWYNGAMNAGRMAGPPIMSAWQLTEHGSFATAALRELFGGEPDEGHPQTRPVGKVTMPALYVCGNKDSAILCNRPYALKTSDYVPDGKYTYSRSRLRSQSSFLLTTRRRMWQMRSLIALNLNKNLLHIPHHFFHQYL